MWKGARDDESLRALHTAVDRGVNFIDTALAYGNGHSEKLVGRVVRERSERILVATKVPPKNGIWPARGTLDEVFPPSHIIDCANRSLANLGLERIDLLQLHVWNPQWIDRTEWHEALDRLKREGKIAFAGLSINDHEPESAVEAVKTGRVDTVQVIYNIFDQSPEDELFGACERFDVGVIARVPFDEGALTGKITPDTEFPRGDWRNAYFKGDRKRQVHERAQSLSKLLGDEATSLPELALRFCLHPKEVATVIPGMRTITHVESNAAVAEQPPLSPKLLAELRKHRWIRNFYPEA